MQSLFVSVEMFVFFLFSIIHLVMTELRSCVKVEVAVPGSLTLTVLMVSVDVKQH